MTLHSYHGRPYRSERRRAGRRILGWVLAFLPGIILLGLWVYTQQLPSTP